MNRVQAARHYLDRHGAEPAVSEPIERPAATRGEMSRIGRQKREIQARLHELEAAAGEAERLRQALEALRAIEPD